MKLIIATQNQGKVEEMRELLSDTLIELQSAKEAGFTQEIEETGETLEENALIKAKTVAEATGQWAVADDTGIFIDDLDGAPGVRTARWAGDRVMGEALAKFALDEMIGLPEEKRTAYFESVVALVAPDGREFTFRGRVNGKITQEMRGDLHEHLPYDTIFIPEGKTQTFAEMSSEEKNKLSHRGRAFEELKQFLQTMESEWGG